MKTDHLVLYHSIEELVTLKGVAEKDGRNPTAKDLGVIRDGAVVVNSETNIIEWAGPGKELPMEYGEIVNAFDGAGEVWLPELVECHTHLVHAGDRSRDFAERAAGRTYQEIAAQGGGILTTLGATRAAGFQQLLEAAQADLERFQKFGVGVVEVKSGYGLTLESEIRMLEVVKALQETSSVILVSTFMPAHVTPPEFKGKTDEYVDLICKEWIPEITKRKLAPYFDAFIEEGFFNLAQTRKLLESAKNNGMRTKLHADQFTDLGGTELGIEMGATSIDHLEKVSDSNIKKLGESNTVAVLCPGASLFTGVGYAPARKMIDNGVRVALSTDYNPGTCPSRNLPLMTTIACSQMKMTVPEAIAGITYNAARALGLHKELGSLEAGKHFRACQLTSSSYESLPYSFGELE